MEGEFHRVVASWGEAWNEPGDLVLQEVSLVVVSDSAELLLVEGGSVPLAVGLDGVEIGIISEDSLENEVNILSLDWHEWA